MTEADKIMEVIRSWYRDRPNVWSGDIDSGYGEWEDAGSPYVWHVSHQAKGYILLSDSGYGKLILYKGGRIVSTSSNFVCSPDMSIIGLGECYGVKSPTLYKKAK